MEDQRVKEFWSSTSLAPKRPSQGFPLIAPQYFRIAVRRKMLYEQGLDFESFQSFLSQTSDPIKSRFYDDLLTVASSENPWKLPKRLCGLPTPPSTPEHSVENSDGKPAREKALFVVEPKSSYATRTLISNGLQVVPDSIPDESNVQDIIPWLSECEQQKLNAVYTSVVDGNNNEQQYAADNPTCVHTYSRAKPVPFSSALDPSNKECASPPGRMDTLPVYQSCLKNTDQYSSGSLYSSHLTDQLCQKPHVSMSPTHDPVPDCMISPVSPSRSLKRPYYQPAVPVIHSATSMPLDRVTRELFAHEYGEYHVAQSPRSTHQQYYRQLAYERLRAQHKAEDVDVSGTQNEPELSRATHNVLERQRRNDLKLRFSMLRDTIPELVNNDKAPKIQILKKSLEYLAELKSQEQRLLADLELEKQRKIILLRRLHALSQETYNY